MLAALLFGRLAFADGAQFFQPQVAGYLSRGSMVSQAVPVPMVPSAGNVPSLEFAEPAPYLDPDARDVNPGEDRPNRSAPAYALPLAVCALALAGSAMRKPIARARAGVSPRMSDYWDEDDEERLFREMRRGQEVVRGTPDQVFRNKAMAYVVVFNPGTASEGVYTLETEVGGTRAYLLTFENTEDADRYCRLLTAEDFNMVGSHRSVSLAAQPLRWDTRRIAEFCYSSDFEVALVPAGGMITPPENNEYDPARFGRPGPPDQSFGQSLRAPQRGFQQPPGWPQPWQNGWPQSGGYDQRRNERTTENQRRGQSVWEAAMRSRFEPRRQPDADDELCGVEECGWEKYMEERHHLEGLYRSDFQGPHGP